MSAAALGIDACSSSMQCLHLNQQQLLVCRMAQAVPNCVLGPAEVPEAPDCSQTWVANQPGTGYNSSLLPSPLISSLFCHCVICQMMHSCACSVIFSSISLLDALCNDVYICKVLSNNTGRITDTNYRQTFAVLVHKHCMCLFTNMPCLVCVQI